MPPVRQKSLAHNMSSAPGQIVHREAAGLHKNGQILDLVEPQVSALLASSASYHALPPVEQKRLRRRVVKVAACAAELARDLWLESENLGQRPLVKTSSSLETPLARAQSGGEEFQPQAAGQVARITEQTLRAVAFPTFVADLIRGTFEAIINASIEQMQSYTELLANVGKTVDQFMSDNITDNQARDWLAQRYPEHLRIRNLDGVPTLQLQQGAEARPVPSWRNDLNLNQDVDLDIDEIEENLVPAARRKLAENRLQVLSTLVLMGMNRLVVTAGKIRATMGFHIDTTDRLHTEQASDFDFRTGMRGTFGFGPWRASASMSLAYVRSTRAQSDHEINLDVDLTGEVELHFRSDYIPLQAFVDSAGMNRIQSNTPVPEQADIFGQIATGGEVGGYVSPRSRRSERQDPTIRRLGEMPAAPDVDLPDLPPEDQGGGQAEAPQDTGGGQTEEAPADTGGGGPADTGAGSEETAADTTAGGEGEGGGE